MDQLDEDALSYPVPLSYVVIYGNNLDIDSDLA